MGYPGSSTLSQEIQQRVVTTFEQTLDLASQGSVQEAKLGCDFILQLDSLFQPARLLRERLEGANGAVPTDDLRGGTNDAPAPTVPDLDLGDLDNLSLDVGETPATPEPATAETDLFADPASLGKAELGSTELVGGDLPSLDARPLPPPGEPAATGGVGGGIALGSPSGGDDSRIDELLAEGQAAYEAKQYQSAIDAWSRIFLIDVDHAEASRRIELARNLKAEHERQVEESFHEAMALLDAGKRDEAAAELEKVLAMQPGHLTAKEYLDKLRSGADTAAAAPTSPPVPDSAASESMISTPTLPDVDEAAALEPTLPDIPDVDHLLEDPSDVPPADVDIDAAPISEMPEQAKRSATGSPSKVFLVIGSAVLLLVLAVGAVVWTKWDSMFPNSAETSAAAPSQPDPIARAQKLHASGETSNAIGILRRLAPSDPNYQEAQALIEQWQIAQQTAAEAETDAGPSEEDLALRDVLISQAEESANGGRNIRAEKLLADAAAIAPLDGEVATLRDEVASAIAPLASELSMFRQGDWEYAVPKLWRVVDGNPGNLDAVQLLSDAYYNLGVRDLQRGDLKGAAGHFNEVVGLTDDPEAARLLTFANTYLDRSEDLLYKTFVKYLPFREL